MYHGIIINGVDLLERDGLVLLADLRVGEATPRENYVTVPGSSGALDFSEAPGGEMTYNQRTITGRLFKHCYDVELETIRRRLAQNYHGRRVNVIFPVNPGVYFSGRLSFGELGEYGSGVIPFTMTADPWAYALTESVKIVNVTAATPVYLCNPGQRVTPTFTTSAPVAVTYGTTTTQLPAGADQKIQRFALEHGRTEISIAPAQGAASAKVVIKWRERFI